MQREQAPVQLYTQKDIIIVLLHNGSCIYCTMWPHTLISGIQMVTVHFHNCTTGFQCLLKTTAFPSSPETTTTRGGSTASRAHAANPYEYVNKESSCTFYHSLFSDHCFVLVRFQVLLLYNRKYTLFIVPFFRGTLGHSAAGEQEASLRAVQYILTFVLQYTKLGIAAKCTTPY